MTQNTPSRELEKVIVRLPDGMRDQLKRSAEKNNRSMNAEIVARLERSLYADSDDGTDRDMSRMRQLIHETMDSVIGTLITKPDILEAMKEQQARSRAIAERDKEFVEAPRPAERYNTPPAKSSRFLHDKS